MSREEQTNDPEEHNGADNTQFENSQPENMDSQEATAQEATAELVLDDAQANQQTQQDLAAEYKDKYLRLYSEFDNYRRRTSKERLELIKTASEDMIQLLLPVLDDLERANQSFETHASVESLKQGVILVQQKLSKTLEAKGLKMMEAENHVFDPDMHQAITQMPAASPELVGKVVQVVEKGYLLHEKPIRFAKVIIGS